MQYKDSIISYETNGYGKEYIVCFHGYGQAAYRWEILAPYLGKHYHLIAFDLPFHGNTHWNKTDRFTPQELLQIIRQVIPPATETIYLLGYSMGGRIALGLLQHAPQMVKKAVFLAPDGLHRNRWYRFATHTIVGRNLFYNCMKNPQLLFRIANEMKKRGAISSAYFNMAHHYANDAALRMQLYNRWIVTRHFHPNLALLKSIIAKHHIPVEMVFGKYDRIIIADHGHTFIKGLEKQARLHILDTGHHFLYQSFAPFIASLFNEEK